MEKPLIDLEELLERTENDRELMRDLLEIFKEEFPQRFQALHQAVQSLNATDVAMEAHALKACFPTWQLSKHPHLSQKLNG